MIAARSGAAPRRATVLAIVGAMALLAQIVACGTLDAGFRDTCLSVVPALEPGDAVLDVIAVAPLPDRADTVRVRYRPAGAAAERDVQCAFGTDEAEPTTPTLIGVRDRSGDLPPARLYLLKRFWLADAAARAEGRARLRGSAIDR